FLCGIRDTKIQMQRVRQPVKILKFPFLKKTPDMLIRQENTTGNYLPGITTIPVMTDLIYGDKWCRNINA
ncbi:hypothetical protein Q4R53_14935, partial [Morganella morganii]